MKALPVVNVFARVAPEHKLKLVNLLKELGEVVAMTGDGVNDAPALKRADIGVAMGITGTEVTKETAAMILLDDNFATLVGAVEEGRAIYDNIKKYLIFLMSCNLALILVLSGTFALKLPLALLALQILWINIIIDGPPALALGVDPKSPDLMSRPPRPVHEGLFNPAVLVVISASTLYLTVALLGVFAYYNHGNVDTSSRSPGLGGPSPHSAVRQHHAVHDGSSPELPFGPSFPVHSGFFPKPLPGAGAAVVFGAGCDRYRVAFPGPPFWDRAPGLQGLAPGCRCQPGSLPGSGANQTLCPLAVAYSDREP